MLGTANFLPDFGRHFPLPQSHMNSYIPLNGTQENAHALSVNLNGYPPQIAGPNSTPVIKEHRDIHNGGHTKYVSPDRTRFACKRCSAVKKRCEMSENGARCKRCMQEGGVCEIRTTRRKPSPKRPRGIYRKTIELAVKDYAAAATKRFKYCMKTFQKTGNRLELLPPPEAINTSSDLIGDSQVEPPTSMYLAKTGLTSQQCCTPLGTQPLKSGYDNCQGLDRYPFDSVPKESSNALIPSASRWNLDNKQGDIRGNLPNGDRGFELKPQSVVSGNPFEDLSMSSLENEYDSVAFNFYSHLSTPSSPGSHNEFTPASVNTDTLTWPSDEIEAFLKEYSTDSWNVCTQVHSDVEDGVLKIAIGNTGSISSSITSSKAVGGNEQSLPFLGSKVQCDGTVIDLEQESQQSAIRRRGGASQQELEKLLEKSQWELRVENGKMSDNDSINSSDGIVDEHLQLLFDELLQNKA